VLIAYEPGTGETLFSGNRLDSRTSTAISLVQGQKYYFEVRHQHGGGTGYIQVGWQRPDGVQEIIPALHLAQYELDPYLATDYSGQAPSFNAAAPSNRGGYNNGDITNAVTLKEGYELLLPLDVVAPQPTTFVWKTNGVIVPGQNLSYFDIQRTPATYNGLHLQAIISNAYGSLTSSVTTVTITPDTTAPTILTVDTAGNPNVLEVIYSKPVNPATATNLANYQVSVVGGGTLAITNATLSADQQTVTFFGAFNFQAGTNYLLRVQNVRDQAVAANTLSPNPAIVPFILSAPLGTTYNFDSGAPSGFSFYGNAGITNNINANGGGLLRLTDAARNQNGAVLLTSRRNIDQVHIKFNTRVGDGGTISGTDQPGDGFSLNISANLPLATFSNPQYGFSPPVTENQFTIFFNAHESSFLNPVSIGVSLNNQILTNVLAGTNGFPLSGIPPITSSDGHWAPVDINILRDGRLNLSFDGVTILTNYQTAWVGIDSAQIGFGAATRTWFETHWIDDLYINFGEGDVGNVGLSTNSILGGTFPEGSLAKLIAVPVGAGPFIYQWYKNGSPISGATSRILTFPAVAGSGGSFSLALSNSFSGLVSPAHGVVIQPDTAPPSVLSARGVAGGVNEVLLTFSETLDPATATALATYSSPYFVVSSAALSTDGRSVILNTTQQRVGTTYPLTIAGLKDASAAGNVLTTNLTFISSLAYQDEVLADKPVRYFKLDETSGTVAFTQTASGDTANTNANYQNLPILGVPPLVPSASSDEYAVRFVAANTNWVLEPNGGDVNDFRGPWSKKTYELWFKANSFPGVAQPGDSGVQAQTHSVSGLWEEGGNLRDIGLYLWNNTTNSNPSQALLAFHAYNSTADGAGSPFGLLTYPAVYITYPVTTNVTYHVVAVLDGDSTGTNGELRLYINSQLVSRSTNGVGQIYNHNGDVEIGQGNGRSHLNVSGVWGAFDGTIDEVSVYNSVLQTNRIVAHYQAGTGASTAGTVAPILVSSVDPRGNPNRLNVSFNQPVSAASAENLSNYALKTAANVTLNITSAHLASDLKTVSLNGAFNFLVGNSYNLTVQGVADILAATNTVASTNLAFTFASAGPVALVGSITNLIVAENQPAQFSVTASGQSPYTYQWKTNGVAWAGQTNSTLSFSAAWNSGGAYSVVVSNEFSSVTSSPAATLTVLSDAVPPGLNSVRAFAGTLNQIVLTFSEPVDPATATNLSTYNIPTSGSTGLTLKGAAISTDGLQVTLSTTPQVNGQTNQLTITSLRDRAHIPNTLTITVQFTSGISYRDEILAEGAVRYWTFDESNGTAFNTLVTKFDADPLNYIGLINGNPALGVPGLVPNVPNSAAISFSKLNTNSSVNLPNGKDLTAILGPWPKITHIFSFKANSLPRVYGATNVEAPAIYGHNNVVLYLYGTQDTNNPAQAQLVFKANNTSSDGPGAPWGGNTAATAKYITYPIVAGRVYNVVAVVDGNASFTGQLRLYVNGSLVGTVTGIGEIYKHPNSPAAFAHAYFTTVQGTNYTIRPDLITYPNVSGGTTHWADTLDGVIDEFAVINGTLSASRISQLYAFSQTNAPNTSFSVVTNTTGSAPVLTFSTVVGSGLSLQWPGAATGYYLEYTTNLASGTWISNPAAASVINGNNVVSQSIGTNGNRFFRLHHP
jgi:hypothetical protein